MELLSTLPEMHARPFIVPARWNACMYTPCSLINPDGEREQRCTQGMRRSRKRRAKTGLVHIRRLRIWVCVSVSFETPAAVGIVLSVELAKPVVGLLGPPTKFTTLSSPHLFTRKRPLRNRSKNGCYPCFSMIGGQEHATAKGTLTLALEPPFWPRSRWPPARCFCAGGQLPLQSGDVPQFANSSSSGVSVNC
jgi:hypothetical protein